jgi:hypothetical protein
VLSHLISGKYALCGVEPRVTSKLNKGQDENQPKILQAFTFLITNGESGLEAEA